ncbi:metallophosphoesterase, partial [Candidatus Poribacteria bacterium]
IIGDRTGGDAEGLKIFERAIYEINQLNPDFAIHIGDKVQGYTRDQSQWLKEYEEFMSYMNKLNAPWYLVAGNHDVFSPIWDTNDRTYEELYKEHFGPIRYSFDYKNSHFVFMYTDDAMTSVPVVADEQIEWLKNDLEGNTRTNVFIFLHKPVWRYDDNNWDAVHQVIKDFPVKAVIAGHFHTYQKDVNRDGIQYYVMGPTGGERHESDHELYGYFHHYNIMRVEGDSFTMGVVKLGNVEADDYILAEDCIRMRYAVIERDTAVKGWLPQPVEAQVEGKIEVTVHNALDVDMPVVVRLAPNRPLWSMEPSILGFTLPANSDVAAEVTVSSPRTAPEDIVPPEFEIEYTYTDAHGRKAPLTTRRRVFLRATHEVYGLDEPIHLDGVKSEPFWQKVAPLYNHTWIFSIYERPDAPPKMWLAADDTDLYFFTEVMDDKYSYLKDNQSRGFLSDAILFSTQPGSGRREIIVFPFNDDGNAFIGKVDERGRLKPSEMSMISSVEYYTRTDEQAGYYYCEGRIPLSLLFDNEQVVGKEVLFNAGVIDNDLEAFIYLRTWAYDRDPQYWGTLRFETEQAP